MPPSVSQIPVSGSAVFLARQPILDVFGRVHAYELLYRNADSQSDEAAEAPDMATARVLHGAMLNVDLESLIPGCPAFVNVSRSFLLAGSAALVPPGAVVLEILETVDVDEEVIAACRHLHSMGYDIALDDFIPGSSAERLFPYARYLKVDVLSVEADDRRQFLASVPRHLRLLAEKVETAEMYADVAAEGFTLFQGYYFCRPRTVQTADVSVPQVATLRLLEALNRPAVGLSEVEAAIKGDASLCQRALRYANSAALGVARPVHSIREALTLIGLDPIRKWVSVWALAGLNASRPSEVMTMAIVRARACEQLGCHIGRSEGGGPLFLLGLCSMLDVMLERPMTEILRAVSVPDRIAKALLGDAGVERALLDAVIACERGNWNAASDSGRSLALSPATLAHAYAEALTWARSFES